jgi:hypothetical protein
MSAAVSEAALNISSILMRSRNISLLHKRRSYPYDTGTELVLTAFEPLR